MEITHCIAHMEPYLEVSCIEHRWGQTLPASHWIKLQKGGPIKGRSDGRKQLVNC